ncbi:amidophosphoribosyltransferase [archaeon]|jgi:amidophosphoribosyltransferase|nr:amidophosphoribosyltransferase [archaeon]
MSGIFGVVSEKDCVEDLFFGTDYHSHLGTMFGGLDVLDGDHNRRIHSLANEQFRSKFSDFYKNVSGKKGMGVISDYEAQPLIFDTSFGKFSIAHVGKVSNLDSLVEDVKSNNGHFLGMSGGDKNPAELMGILINQGKDYVDGIQIAQEQIRGSSSMMLLADEGIYLARDKFGRTPIVVGKKDGAMAATLETTAFLNQGFEVEKNLGPGEIGILTEKGYEQLKKPEDKSAICSFLWVYYGYPSSDYLGINVEDMRNKSGGFLARIDKEEGLEVDLVAGIPDSGTAHAIGFAEGGGYRYGRPFVKYTPTWPRSFMPQDQSMRNLVAQKKLLPIKAKIEGKKILFCEDSIVRGTQLRDNIKMLYDEYGAKEVHMRPACPPLIHSCEFLNFSRSKSVMDLAGRKAIARLEGRREYDLEVYADENSEPHASMVDEIRKDIGLTSLRYQKMGDMVSAIGLPKKDLCTYCWDGKGKCGGCD